MHPFEIWRLMEEKAKREKQNESESSTSRRVEVEVESQAKEDPPESLPEEGNAQSPDNADDGDIQVVRSYLDNNGLVAIQRDNIISPGTEFGQADKAIKMFDGDEFIGYIKFTNTHIKVCMNGSPFFNEYVAFKD